MHRHHGTYGGLKTGFGLAAGHSPPGPEVTDVHTWHDARRNFGVVDFSMNNGSNERGRVIVSDPSKQAHHGHEKHSAYMVYKPAEYGSKPEVALASGSTALIYTQRDDLHFPGSLADEQRINPTFTHEQKSMVTRMAKHLQGGAGPGHSMTTAFSPAPSPFSA